MKEFVLIREAREGFPEEMVSELRSGGQMRFNQEKVRGSWVAQSVKRATSAQVMISWFVSWNPMSCSRLSVQSPFWILCPLSLSAPPLLTLSQK